MHTKKIYTDGRNLNEAKKALIMIHGRGGSAEDILSLAAHLKVTDYALLAPQATNHTWYPYSFMMETFQNEPWLSSALSILSELVTDVIQQGISKENIYFLGFSQGACLTLEFVARNASRYGGVAAFTGGLIGDQVDLTNYSGDFAGTPIFIGTSNPDSHVPLKRVKDTTRILQDMNAAVTEKVYEGMGHTINADEIKMANELIFSSKQFQS